MINSLRPSCSVSVRPARAEDTHGIVEVHCSDVERWVRVIGGREVEVDYAELTWRERIWHGGPWMDERTCLPHVQAMTKLGFAPLVAELEGKIVGNAEFFIGQEGPVFGRHFLISILYVHRDYRRGRGVGSALMNAMLDIARAEGCDTVGVFTEEGSRGFYRKFNFNPWGKMICVRCRAAPQSSPWGAEPMEYGGFAQVEGVPMRIGRYFSSRQCWEGPRLPFMVHEDGALENESPLACYRLRSESAEAVAMLRVQVGDAAVRLWSASLLDAGLFAAVRNLTWEFGAPFMQAVLAETDFLRLRQRFPLRRKWTDPLWGRHL